MSCSNEESARRTALESDVFSYNIIISAHERLADRGLARAWRDPLVMLREFKRVELEAASMPNKYALETSFCAKKVSILLCLFF